MGKPTVVVITERESLRGLLRAAAGASASSLGFATSRSDLMILLGRGDVRAVAADALGRGPSAYAQLAWVKEKQPWVRLFLMAKEDPWDLPEARQLKDFVTFLKVPSGLSEARELLRTLFNEPPQEILDTETPSRGLQYEDEDADQEIILSVTELIDQLPALPLVVQRILNLLGREDSSSRQIADAISLDPALAARVLRLVNSALFALADPVTTVQHAVRLLGFAEIRNLTMGLKIMETSFGQAEGILDRSKFWEHSLACGICAKHLAIGFQEIDSEEAFLGGLLHDIGKLVLDSYFQEAWAEAMDRSMDSQSLPLDMERKVVGLPHTTIGRMLARHWKIPELHQAAIEHHHRIPQAGQRSQAEYLLCAVVLAANLLVRWLDLGTSGPSVLLPIPKELINLLRLEDKRLKRVMADTLKEVGEWKATLGFERHASADNASINPPQEKEPCRLWVVSPVADRAPSLSQILEVSGYLVDRSHWGEKLLEKAQEVQCTAVIMDLRSLKAEPEKMRVFLHAFRKRTQVPILLVARNGNELPLQEMPQDVHLLEGFPHRGTLCNWLERFTMLPADSPSS